MCHYAHLTPFLKGVALSLTIRRIKQESRCFQRGSGASYFFFDSKATVSTCVECFQKHVITQRRHIIRKLLVYSA